MNISMVIPQLCTGCGACYNKCPIGAIQMQENKEGFLYPAIDTGICTGCGQCTAVCPALHPNYPNTSRPALYAYMANDELRHVSSSGGMFTLLARTVLHKGGYVCGASYTKDFSRVNHILIDSEDDLPKLRKSKYLQSDTNTVYRRIGELLSQGKPVLFCGCPCQVAGLRGFLARDEEQLLLVDVLCHCVPSPKVWQHYMQEVGNNREVNGADFRDKDTGWNTFIHLHFSDGSRFDEGGESLPWLAPFICGIIDRKSCRLCRFARLSRQGDITIGDFWGIEQYDASLNDGKGCNLVTVNNAKGAAAFAAVRVMPETQRCDEVPLEFAVNKNPRASFYCGNPLHPGRDTFFREWLAGTSYREAISKAKAVKYDYGIIGWWYTNNYGAVLTSFALYKHLEQSGYRPLLLDVPNHLFANDQRFRDNFDPAHRFMSQYCEISERYSDALAMRDLNNECRGFIVGSDQMWRQWPGQIAAQDAAYYLDFADDNKIKIAYATSFGADAYFGNEDDLKRTAYYLHRFDALSVREMEGVQLCHDRFRLEAEHAIDPVFLLDPQVYRDCANQAPEAAQPLDKYIFAYILQHTEEKEKILLQVSERMSLPVKMILDMNSDNRYAGWSIPALPDSGIESWLYLMAHAELVITDSFHGFCFAMILRKRFIALEPRDGRCRFSYFAEMAHVQNRVFCHLSQIENDITLFDEPDYSDVFSSLAPFIEQSRKWLQDKLTITRTNVNEMTGVDELALKLRTAKCRLDQSIGNMHSRCNEANDRLNQTR